MRKFRIPLKSCSYLAVTVEKGELGKGTIDLANGELWDNRVERKVAYVPRSVKNGMGG
jgi:hypothetical protein